MSTATVTIVFCDRCNPQQVMRVRRGTTTIFGQRVEAKLRKLGWRRYWDGKTAKAKRPIAPMFAAAGGGS